MTCPAAGSAIAGTTIALIASRRTNSNDSIFFIRFIPPVVKFYLRNPGTGAAEI